MAVRKTREEREAEGNRYWPGDYSNDEIRTYLNLKGWLEEYERRKGKPTHSTSHQRPWPLPTHDMAIVEWAIEQSLISWRTSDYGGSWAINGSRLAQYNEFEKCLRGIEHIEFRRGEAKRHEQRQIDRMADLEATRQNIGKPFPEPKSGISEESDEKSRTTLPVETPEKEKPTDDTLDEQAAIQSIFAEDDEAKKPVDPADIPF